MFNELFLTHSADISLYSFVNPVLPTQVMMILKPPAPATGYYSTYNYQLLDRYDNSMRFSSCLLAILCASFDPVVPCITICRLLNLSAFTSYAVALAATNSIGAGPMSPFANFSTVADVPLAPSIPRLRTCFRHNSTYLLASWQPPLGRTRGIILQYQVLVLSRLTNNGTGNMSSMLISTNSTTLSIELNATFSHSIVRVRAYTSAGPGSFSDRAIFDVSAPPLVDETSEPTPLNVILAPILVTLFLLVLLVAIILRRRPNLFFKFPAPDKWHLDRFVLLTLQHHMRQLPVILSHTYLCLDYASITSSSLPTSLMCAEKCCHWSCCWVKARTAPCGRGIILARTTFGGSCGSSVLTGAELR